MSKFATLIKLVKKGESQKLADTLQQQTFNINEVDPKSGKALLHMAIENSDIDIFQVLISQIGINLEQPTKDGEYPLQMAVRLNDVHLVSRLLELKVNARKKNMQGQTVLHTAIRNQTHGEIIKKLTTNIFDINEGISQYGNFLNLAIETGQSENFFFLIKQVGIRYTVRDQEDNTCLILAVKNNKGDYVVAILEKLEEDFILNPIEKQFFINSQNKEGNTALHEACLRDYQTITQKLQTIGSRFGIDVTIKNKKGQNVQAIKIITAKSRINEIQSQKKRQEQKIVRKKEKNEEKAKQREEEERERIQEKRKNKQEEARIFLETKIKTQANKKKTIWIMSILFIIVLSGMYLAIVNVIEKKKAAESF